VRCVEQPGSMIYGSKSRPLTRKGTGRPRTLSHGPFPVAGGACMVARDDRRLPCGYER
jgi:hypothetical protein